MEVSEVLQGKEGVGFRCSKCGFVTWLSLPLKCENCTLPHGWWLNVEETYCEKCGKMTPCHQYQGHFICNVCGELTGFWMPVDTVPDIEGVKKWNKEATALVPVQFRLRVATATK